MFLTENIFLFDGLSDAEKQQIKGLLPESRSFSKGEKIYTSDRYEKAMGVLLDGTAGATSGRIIKRNFCTGDVFGVAALFGEHDGYISEITAKSKCTVQFIPEQTLLEIFRRYGQTSLNYIAFLSDRVRFLNERIAQLSRPDTHSKLLSFLVDGADENGEVCADNMSSLCRMVGIGRTSLYRSLDELEKNGLIERKSNKIRVIQK